MDDFDKTRVAYVASMESKLEHMRSECDRYKSIAEKWEPVITTQTDTATGNTKFGLRFGGKNVHATVSNDFLVQMDITGATSNITDALVESLVVEQISKIIRVEVERVHNSAVAASKAGKW
jgi:hypothetical protein